ncbi:outer membrane channel protein TolC [Zophobihabitans entericus]|uniref:Outer membrane channel protein TolC n=1 Tax=Zophobihabitans entericus TaxID=1635327 RepID=A0A6G9ICR1_9GAMM|nr:outer membrane channel protein TolC [Zophobihabitans entericus]QIQ21612.1 outer membrane channel protein TolC [Zophobihabitans entericus]
MKKVIPLLIGLCFSQYALAEDLLQVYEQARSSNPDLRSAQAERDKAYAAISGSRASLLPQLGLKGSYGVAHGYREADDQNTKSGSLTLNLSQSLFDFSSWKALSISQKAASIQDMTYEAQEQTLILDTAVAYFNVLKSIDTLSYIDAQKQAIYRQLEQTRQKHRVGLVAITDVQNAQADYDQTIAQQVSAHNDLNNAIEDLRQVSGRFYASLATINTSSFATEKPEQINRLLQQSENTNLSLLAARLSLDLSKEQIRQAEAGHMPTLTLDASTGIAKNESYGSAAQTPGNRINGTNQISLNLNVPIFSGGATQSQVKQAQYNYVVYSEKLESTNRSVVNQVRSSHNNISASISSIKAYQQTVISAQSSLEATQSGYEVGTRTIVDVLTATTTLYNAKQQLSDAKYNYLTNLLRLKYAVGTLTADDLVTLNNMLGAQVGTIVSID